jgi:tetratricopeptide (TPR) repeat protein/4-amino-4-deoxy-L-arabinose transferase-like glycosyltransferase
MAQPSLPRDSGTGAANPKIRSDRRGGDLRYVSLPWLLGLIAAALAIKGVVLAQLGNHPLLQPHGELDTAYYVELAQKVAHGGPLAVAEPFFVSPLYVFFLALVFKLSGGSLLAARVVQVLLGAAAVAFLYLTARVWFSEQTARISAMLFATTGFFAFSEILLLQAALDPFLTCCTLYFVSRTQVDGRRWPLAAAGISMGLFALNRPNALAYGLAVAALIAVASWRRSARQAASHPARMALGRAALFLAGLFLVLVPNALRNYAVSGEAILISSHGGLNFFMGNHAGADGTYQQIAGITPSIAGQARDAQRVAEQAMGRPLSTGEASSYFYSLAGDWIAEHPAEALTLLLRKIAILVNKTNVALNASYAFYSREPTLLRFLIVGPWLLLPLGLAGLCLPSQRSGRSGFWVWASFVPIYGLSVAAFFVSDRYRLPLLVPLCITSAATLGWLTDRLRSRRPVRLVSPALVLGLAFTATCWNLGLSDGLDDEQTSKAVWLIEKGAYKEAQEYVASISARHAHPGMLRYQMGLALAAAGRYEDAIGQFLQALDIDPGQNAIHLALGQALAAAKRPAEAVPHLTKVFDEGYEQKVSGPALVWALASAGQSDEAVKRLSAFADAFAEQSGTALLLGTIAFEGQAPAQAERWFRIAAALAPDEPEAHFKLGAVLLLSNRAQEAVAPLETAVRLDPQNASARRNLALAYANCGRFAEARAQGEEALRLDPSETQLRAFLRSLTHADKKLNH